MKKLVYFDSAATSYPKPQNVIRAVNECFVTSGGNPGRSSHVLALSAARSVFSCREAISELISFEYPENVVFTYNTTYALNMAIKGLFRKNSRILVSNLEHNSVLRPVHALSKIKENFVEYDVFDALGSDEEVIASFKSKLFENTGLAVVTMASNVCGKILPVAEISKLCRENGTRLIVDCAQSAGCVPFTFDEVGADALCMPAHKGLYGIQGCGFCVFSKDVLPECIIEGGSGVNSKELLPYEYLPERLEAGTVGTPAICALKAGIEYVREVGIEEIFERNRFLADYLSEGLRNIGGVTVYGECENRTACVLFGRGGVPSEECAQRLSDVGICVRGGLHCAPLAHKAFGTENSGAVRVSMSHKNTKREIDRLLSEVARMK